jgi:hypothetical protein
VDNQLIGGGHNRPSLASGIGSNKCSVFIFPGREFGWSGLAIFGDSGSAVRVGTGLQAAGDLTHLVVYTRWLPSYIAGTRIQRMLAIARRWSLVSSPICL